MAMSDAQKDLLARNRAVKGWAFKDLPEKENEAIKEFLNGGPTPDGYEGIYNLCRRQLGLPSDKMKASMPNPLED
jgi:hypothetical protein